MPQSVQVPVGVAFTDQNLSSPDAAVRPLSFESIFQTECSYVLRLLARLGVKESEREDLAQEVFLLVSQRLNTFDPDKPLRPWLFAFVFRVASNHRRLRHSKIQFEEIDQNQPDPAASESAFETKQQQDLVIEVLQTIPFDRRTALIMHDIDGFEGAQIAEILSIPLNTVYSRIRVAREEFTASLHRLQTKGGRR